jgi:hypothetical protein
LLVRLAAPPPPPPPEQKKGPSVILVDPKELLKQEKKQSHLADLTPVAPSLSPILNPNPHPITTDQLEFLPDDGQSFLQLLVREKSPLGFQDPSVDGLASPVFESSDTVLWRRREGLRVRKDDYFAVELIDPMRSPTVRALVAQTPDLAGRAVYLLLDDRFGDELKQAIQTRKQQTCPASAPARAVVDLTPRVPAGFLIARMECGLAQR